MQAKSFLQLALSTYQSNLSLLSVFYSQPFSINVIANPIGEVCPVHAKDFSSMRDKDYEKWADTEKNILFKYWMKSEFGNDFINVKGNCIYFKTDSYVIRTDRDNPETAVIFPLPSTLDDFINDCNRVGIELYWKENVVNKYFK